MVDVVICAHSDNEAAARQLADALRREGWSVWRDEAPPSDGSPNPAVTDQIADAKAVVVVWSAAAIAAPGVRAEANMARSLRRLVQVSADDAAVTAPFDPDHVVSIAGWSGEPEHPGWQRARAEVEARAGTPDRSASEISRPIASTSAISAPPALPSDMNTSNGWPLSSSVIVT